MAEERKGRPPLTGKQLRFLFARGILRGTGKGKQRKVTLVKSGGKRDFSATRAARVAAGKAKAAAAISGGLPPSVSAGFRRVQDAQRSASMKDNFIDRRLNLRRVALERATRNDLTPPEIQDRRARLAGTIRLYRREVAKERAQNGSLLTGPGSNTARLKEARASIASVPRARTNEQVRATRVALGKIAATNALGRGVKVGKAVIARSNQGFGVSGPYNAVAKDAAKASGARWDAGGRAWVFPTIKKARDYARRYYRS